MQNRCLRAVLFSVAILGGVQSAFAQGEEPQSHDRAAPTPPAQSPGQAEESPFGKAPDVRVGPFVPEIARAVELVFGVEPHAEVWGQPKLRALELIAASNDVRLAWLIGDLMRFTASRDRMTLLVSAATELMGIELNPINPWGRTSDHLIAWDIPAPPNYLKLKRRIYLDIDSRWERIFVEGDIDWRHVSWGGVHIDDRAFGTTDEPCNCIPAADNPEVSDVSGASWLADDAIVFGIEVNGEFRAYPRRIMEVREMVNDTLGGRDLGIPYCTLCGSAQAYFTDRMPKGVERPILRTTGLLLRSNKIMFDIQTYSVLDTFRGNAVTGPLAEAGVVLEQTGVVTTTWLKWRQAHPDTTVLVESLALGRNFDFRNNRDADGPIFPIGDRDARLPVQAEVLGVVNLAGKAIAFHEEYALAKLARGEEVVFEGVHLLLDGGGLRAVDADGKDLGGHLAFWFAWSQFHPETALWRE